ncbi:MAG: histidine kinase [Planctomycetes bacterium]|nr:histidine kinase [Planctomycetota bacterium]
MLLYFLPLLLLGIFFHIQYHRIAAESARAHLQVIAEHQAITLNLFLRERLVNLDNVIDDPAFRDLSGRTSFLERALADLRLTSDAFVDLGVVGGDGLLLDYQGPVHFPGAVNYRDESWFKDLLGAGRKSVITDIYLGVRNNPHFTIAVKRERDGEVSVLRSALSPEKIHEFLASLEGAGEVHAAVVNAAGVFQVVTPRVGLPLNSSPYLPPRSPLRGPMRAAGGAAAGECAYAWLSEVPWALVVQDALPAAGPASLLGMPRGILLITLAFFAIMGGVIVLRARQLVTKQLAAERHEADLSGQLVHAARLASVGELAAGIAHEINNPLAIIAEEAGLLKDSLDPDLPEDEEEPDLKEHLRIIHDAVFRCRDITRKLLAFVRHAEVKLEQHSIDAILEDVVGGMLGSELATSNIAVVCEYDPEAREILTDRNQLAQVLVNLVKNAIDAMSGGGTLTIRTAHKGDRLLVKIKDSGCGMTPEQLQKVFMPFFTTKAPGKGTGLGLSVSFSIIKNFGGNMYVVSNPGQGSTFTLELPYAMNGQRAV